ncbi:MAG TPA: DDE-type integrase/transposase/recombinase [Acidobacteriota bacterium]|jgi:transposase InsO family protein
MTEEVKQQQDPTESIAGPAEPTPVKAVGSYQQDSGPQSEPVAEQQAADEVVDLLDELPRLPCLSGGRARTRRLVVKEQNISGKALGPEQRLLLLDTWRRSGLSGGEFEALVGISKHTLYAWKQRFERDGPAGLMPRQRESRRASRLAQATQRAILMLKADNPDWGCQRISDVLARASGLGASAASVAYVLKEAGYQCEEIATRAHAEPVVRRFEGVKCNSLWQTDIFTFVLKRQNRRVHLVAFMDDHSRFIVSFGLHATASTALVIEVFRSAIASFTAPEEILTDNGPQYVTWRGKSAFGKECEARGVRQIVARVRHPQTLGKIERFWGTLWRECLQSAVFIDLEDARRRIGHFIDYYNFQRPHQGIDGLVPADRYFGAASQVREMLQVRVAENALSLATNGIPKEPFYLTGQVAGKNFSLHTEGERVILTTPEGQRREINLQGPADWPSSAQAPADQPADGGSQQQTDPNFALDGDKGEPL